MCHYYLSSQNFSNPEGSGNAPKPRLPTANKSEEEEEAAGGGGGGEELSSHDTLHCQRRQTGTWLPVFNISA